MNEDSHSRWLPEDSHSRWLPMEGCANFRDLGGYQNSDGRTVRWRRLFRSDALQDLTPADTRLAIEELHIDLVLDLRNSNEAERDGKGPLPALGAQYLHLPLLEERGIPPFTGENVVERLSATYLWLIQNSGPLVAEAVEAIAGSESGVVFHCSAGKDRTGLTAAIVLGVLGVDDETIAADYLLTNQAIEGVLKRIKNMEQGSTVTAQSLAAQPAAFQRFRETLRQEYGGAESYLRQNGVTDETLDRLRSNLLE